MKFELIENSCLTASWGSESSGLVAKATVSLILEETVINLDPGQKNPVPLSAWIFARNFQNSAEALAFIAGCLPAIADGTLNPENFGFSVTEVFGY